MVGRARVELATSRLSGVRSNHLSYRPILAYPSRPKEPQVAVSQLRQQQTRTIVWLKSSSLLQKMKGHEDDGHVLRMHRSSSIALPSFPGQWRFRSNP